MKIHSIGELAFIRKYTDERLTEGFLPIWRQVIALGILNLERMYRDLVGPTSVVLGYHTDSIKLTNPRPFKAGVNPGDYQLEPKCRVIGHNCVSGEGWAPVARVWRDVEVIPDTGCLVVGPGGSGKTHHLIRLAKQHDNRLIVGYTKRSVENINLREAVGAMTLDAAFPADKPDAVRNHKAIFVDEFSMVQPYHFAKIWRLHYKTKPATYLFGDNNQMPPMTNTEQPYNRINYEESALAYYLCGGARCRLPYLGHRYDEEAFIKLTTLLRTNKVECDKKLWPSARMTLCKLPATRHRINQERFKEAVGDKFKLDDGSQWFVGMPLIAYANNRKLGIVNSHHYTLAKEGSRGLECKNSATDAVVCVPDALMTKLFRYGWCDTVQRVQGGELPYQYNIVDVAHMNRNDLYTALSRCTKWADIGLESTALLPAYLPASSRIS